jgi:hypothetical protein
MCAWSTWTRRAGLDPDLPLLVPACLMRPARISGFYAVDLTVDAPLELVVSAHLYGRP